TQFGLVSMIDYYTKRCVTGIISGYMEVGRVYTGKNILKNHWPIISIIVAILISIVITITR
ncbi:hypothetical protein L0P28_15750, partial [Dorea formicigenerans]|nr:hypothetical protein [Dorea formicigenerans]